MLTAQSEPPKVLLSGGRLLTQATRQTVGGWLDAGAVHSKAGSSATGERKQRVRRYCQDPLPSYAQHLHRISVYSLSLSAEEAEHSRRRESKRNWNRRVDLSSKFKILLKSFCDKDILNEFIQQLAPAAKEPWRRMGKKVMMKPQGRRQTLVIWYSGTSGILPNNASSKFFKPNIPHMSASTGSMQV